MARIRQHTVCPHSQSETHATVQTNPTADVIRKGNYLLLENVLVPRSYSAAQVCGVLPITHRGKAGKWILLRDNSACRLLFYVFQFPSSLSTSPPPTFCHLHLNGIFIFSESIFSHLFPIQASKAQLPRAEPLPGDSKDWAKCQSCALQFLWVLTVHSGHEFCTWICNQLSQTSLFQALRNKSHLLYAATNGIWYYGDPRLHPPSMLITPADGSSRDFRCKDTSLRPSTNKDVFLANRCRSSLCRSMH